MNTGLIGAAALLLLLLISVAWALIRGVTKARIRLICVVLCAVAAFGITIAARGKLDAAYEEYAPQIEQFFRENGMEDVWTFVNESSAVRNVIEESGGALLAPILALVLFIVLQLATWVIYFIVTLILHGAIKRREERRHFRLLRAMAYGIVQFAVILFVFLTPLFAYLQLAPSLVKIANEANMIPAQTQETVNQENVEKVNNSPVFTVYGKAGGSALNKQLTKMTIQGEKTYLADEMDSIATLTTQIMTLKNAGSMENWDAEEAEAIKTIAASLGDSKIIASLVGDVLGSATDKWLAGEAFFGMAKPSVGEYLDPVFDLLLEDLNEDSKSLTAISNDFKTIGDLISILVRDGVLAKLNDTDTLSDLLTKGTTVKDMIEVLKANKTLSNLVSEFTKMGMKAVGNMLKLPEVDLSDYEEFFDQVTDKLNDVLKDVDFSDRESVDAAIDDLTEKLQGELEKANVDVELSDDIIDLYSDVIIEQFKDKEGEITVDDLKELFGITTSVNTTEEITE